MRASFLVATSRGFLSYLKVVLEGGRWDDCCCAAAKADLCLFLPNDQLTGSSRNMNAILSAFPRLHTSPRALKVPPPGGFAHLQFVCLEDVSSMY